MRSVVSEFSSDPSARLERGLSGDWTPVHTLKHLKLGLLGAKELFEVLEELLTRVSRTVEETRSARFVCGRLAAREWG